MGNLAWSAVLAAGSAALAFVQHAPTHASASHSEAAQLFKQRCSGCHVTPDPEFEADRAYIRQIFDTA